ARSAPAGRAGRLLRARNGAPHRRSVRAGVVHLPAGGLLRGGARLPRRAPAAGSSGSAHHRPLPGRGDRDAEQPPPHRTLAGVVPPERTGAGNPAVGLPQPVAAAGRSAPAGGAPHRGDGRPAPPLQPGSLRLAPGGRLPAPRHGRTPPRRVRAVPALPPPLPAAGPALTG